MENEIPTAEEYIGSGLDGLEDFIKDPDILQFYKELAKTIAIEFAKLHVEAALKAASEKGVVFLNAGYLDKGILKSMQEGKKYDVCRLSKESITNAYPLENIK